GGLGDVPTSAERVAPLGCPRVDGPHAVPAALPVQRRRVEVADQAGPQHRDRVLLHSSLPFVPLAWILGRGRGRDDRTGRRALGVVWAPHAHRVGGSPFDVDGLVIDVHRARDAARACSLKRVRRWARPTGDLAVNDIAPLVQIVLMLGAVATPAVLLARVIQGDERGSLRYLLS